MSSASVSSSQQLRTAPQTISTTKADYSSLGAKTHLRANSPIVVWFVAIALIALSSTQHLVAQDSVPGVVGLSNRTGDVPYSAQIGSQFEHVELSNGNLIVEIPFLNLPGRGISFNYGIRYDAAYWVVQNQLGGAPEYWNPEMRNWLTTSTLGWTSTQPYATSYQGQMTCVSQGNQGAAGSPTVSGSANPTDPANTDDAPMDDAGPGTPGEGSAAPAGNPSVSYQGQRADSFIFTDTHGSKHQILNNMQSNGDCTGGSYSFSNLQGPSVDQQGFWGTGFGSTVIGPDGTQYAQGGTSGGRSGSLPGHVFVDMAKITDTRGNTEVMSPGNIDTVGRTPITQQVGTNQITYTVTDSSGTPQTYVVNLETISINTQFNITSPQVKEYSATRTTVKSVVLPNLQSYSFSYDAYGDVTKITLPTGGYVSYQWQNILNNSSVIRSVVSRTVNDGVTSSTWNIAYAFSSTSSTYTVTLTSPHDPQGAAHTTVYTYGSTGGPEVLLGVVYDPGSDGSYVRGYQMSYYPSQGFASVANVYSTNLLHSITTTLDAGPNGSNGTVSKKEFDYDIFAYKEYDFDCSTFSQESICESWASGGGLPAPTFDSLSHGNVTAIREYGAGAGAPGSLVRQTIRKYLQDSTSGYGMSPNGLDPLKRVKYTGANIVDKAIDETVYDGSSVCTGTGTINLDTGAFTPPLACGATRLAERTVQYDNSTPGTYGYHGEETSTARWLNTPNSFLTTTYVRDGFGNLTSITDPLHNTTTIGYTDSFAASAPTCSIAANSETYPTSITDALQHTRKLTYYGCTGKVSADQDPNDIAAGRAGTTYNYDEMNRILIQTNKDTGQISNSYNDAYPSTITTSTLMSAGVNETAINQMDGLGRTIQTTLSSDPEGAVLTKTTYDALGRVYWVTNPYRSTSEGTYGLTTTTYDGINRPVLVQMPDNNTQKWSYNGNITTYTDESGSQWQRTTDALGRLTKVLEPNGSTQTPTMETDYAYDALDNLLKVTQNGAAGSTARIRNFGYDSLSRLLSASNPETGTVNYGYDANSNVQTKTDARNISTTYTYDALNRVLTEQAPGTSYSYAYDNTTNGSSGIGRLFSETNNVNVGRGYYYDKMGRSSSVVFQNPSIGAYQSGFAAIYDLAGNVQQLTYPDGRVIKQAWDAAGRIQSVTYDNWNGTHVGYNYLASSSYYPNGAVQSMSFGNGAVKSVSLNNRLQPTEISMQMIANSVSLNVFDKQFCYGAPVPSFCPAATQNNNGNILSIPDTLSAANTQQFTYDTINRIKSFVTTDGRMQQTFTIDSFGNASAVAPGTLQNNLSFDPINLNRISSSRASYDASGNVTAMTNGVSTTSFTYDSVGQLTQVNGGATATYTYSPSGERVRKDDNGTYTEYVYWGGQPLAEKNADGSWSDYIVADGQRIARADSYDVRIHTHGTQPGGAGASWSLPTSGVYTIKAGDILSWRQYQVNGYGGPNVQFTDGTQTNRSIYDTAGQQVVALHTQNAWVGRSADLSGYAGKMVQDYQVVTDGTSPAGTFDIWYGEMAIVSTDGTVTTIYNRQNGVSLSAPWTSGMTQLNAVTETSNVTQDAITPISTTTYLAGDQLGSARMEFAAGGWPLSSDTFYPFGQEQSPPVTTNHYKFTGKERDAESGNDYFGARYYASSMGRWMSPDTDFNLKRILPNPQRWNRYAYVINNPLVLVDPDGLTDIYVFRPEAKTNGAAWNRAIKDAKANGNNVIMANGSNATRAAYLKALGTPDAQVVFVGHSVDDATGKAGSLLLTGNQAVGKLSPFVNPDGTGGTVPSVATPGNIDAQSVGAFACTSDTLSGQYFSTDFSGLSGLVFDRTADAGAAAYTDVLAKDGSTADADSAAQKAMDRTQTTINPSDGKPAGPAPKVKDHPND